MIDHVATPLRQWVWRYHDGCMQMLDSKPEGQQQSQGAYQQHSQPNGYQQARGK